MKKPPFLTLLAISLLGVACFNPLAYNTLNPCDGFTQQETRNWISNNITYLSDPPRLFGIPEYWQSPKETLSLLTGDCEDFSILYIWLNYLNTGEQLSMAILKFPTGYHAGVLTGDDKLLEPQSKTKFHTWEYLSHVVEFNSLFQIATIYGLKGIEPTFK